MRRIQPAAAVALALALTLTACTANDEKPPEQLERLSDERPMNNEGAELVEPGGPQSPRGDLPSPDDVDDRDPEAVADAVAQATHVVDTKTDNSPSDGLRRAAPWLTPEYAAAAAQPRPATGGKDWADLAAINGYTTATALASDETQGGKRDGRTVVLTRIVTITRHNDTGQPVDTQRVGVVVNLIRAAGTAAWRVDAITTI